MGLYFIYDCNNNVVGNPKGYRTFKGADRQQNSRWSKAREAIWTAFEEKYGKHDSTRANVLVSSIKLKESK